jgi:hypothetical protein
VLRSWLNRQVMQDPDREQATTHRDLQRDLF